MNFYPEQTLISIPRISSLCCTQGDKQPTTTPDHFTEDLWTNLAFDDFTLSAPDPSIFESTTPCRDAYVLISQQNYRAA